MRRVTRRSRIRAVALTYAAIGVAGAAAPACVPAVFGGSAPGPESRTEVRTVYAGIPLAFGGTLAWAAHRPDHRTGSVDAVAIASAGMAIARLGGSAVERRLKPWPTGTFAVLETAMAAALVRGPRRRSRRDADVSVPVDRLEP